jgi:YD repeat-containing protein
MAKVNAVECPRRKLIKYCNELGLPIPAGTRIGMTQITDSQSGTITRTYDLLDRLIQETTPQGSISYTYDAAGRRTSMTVAGQPTVTYTYDANRLASVTQASSVVTVTYDAAGRRTSVTLPNGVVTEYTYDAASRVTGLAYRKDTTTHADDRAAALPCATTLLPNHSA